MKTMENTNTCAPLMELKAVSRTFCPGKTKEVHALRNVGFTVQRGDRIAVMGPSGSGKSTLLHILAMLDLPSSGEYRYDGQDTKTLSEAKRAALRGGKIGIVLQDYGMIKDLTAMENAEIPLVIAGRKSRESAAAVRSALEKVGLGDKLHVKAALLSGGEQQRVAIARVIASGAEVILADEPTGAEGKTILVVTHNPMVAERCTRRFHILDGELREET